MWSIRCGFGVFSDAGALVLEQVLTAQITRIRRVICICQLEKLLSSDIKYCPFHLIQNKDVGSRLGGTIILSQIVPSCPNCGFVSSVRKSVCSSQPSS